MLNIYSEVYSPIQVNSYVLYNNNKQAIIIDPGCYYQQEKEQLAAFISSQNLIVEKIILTHCHLDHVFGLAWACETYNLQPYYHPLEEKMLALAATSGLMYNLPFTNYNGAYHALYHGQTISLGTEQLQVIHLPGHSVGSVGFYCQAQNFIIVGDVLFYESIGRTDLPGGNMETLTQSIQTKLFNLPENTKVYNGHGQATTIAHEKLHNPFVGLGH
jgi:hydroxyacylglutathione hydrolase